MTTATELPESTFDDTARKAFLSSGQVIHGFHQSTVCKNERCPVHKPTDHELRQYALWFNFNSFLFERLVPALDGESVYYVPDPDDYNLLKNNGVYVYRNAAVCRFCKEEVVSYRDYDENTCSCGELKVKGGHKKMERIGTGWIENSIIYSNGRFL